LREDLGVEHVELADPSSCAIQLSNDLSITSLREQPAQFMVAVGLAARGAWEL